MQLSAKEGVVPEPIVIATIEPATPNYGGAIRVEIDDGPTVLLFQSEDGYRDMIGIELPKLDELISALQAAKAKALDLSAGHGAQGEPATVFVDLAHETPGRHSVSSDRLAQLLSYIERQSTYHAESHRDVVVKILEGRDI